MWFFVFGQVLLKRSKWETRFAILPDGVPSFVQVWNLHNISPTSFLFKSLKTSLRKKLWDRYSMRVKIWASMTPWTCFYLSLEGPFSRGDPRWTTPASAHALLRLPLTLGSPMACFWPMQQKDFTCSQDFVIEASVASGEAIYHLMAMLWGSKIPQWGKHRALGQRPAVEPNVWVKRHLQCPAQSSLPDDSTPVTISLGCNYVKDPQ